MPKTRDLNHHHQQQKQKQRQTRGDDHGCGRGKSRYSRSSKSGSSRSVPEAQAETETQATALALETATAAAYGCGETSTDANKSVELASCAFHPIASMVFKTSNQIVDSAAPRAAHKGDRGSGVIASNDRPKFEGRAKFAGQGRSAVETKRGLLTGDKGPAPIVPVPRAASHRTDCSPNDTKPNDLNAATVAATTMTATITTTPTNNNNYNTTIATTKPATGHQNQNQNKNHHQQQQHHHHNQLQHNNYYQQQQHSDYHTNNHNNYQQQDYLTNGGNGAGDGGKTTTAATTQTTTTSYSNGTAQNNNQPQQQQAQQFQQRHHHLTTQQQQQQPQAMAHYKFHNDCQSSVLTYEQVKRLDRVMDQVVPIHGRGQTPTLFVKLKELIRLVKRKLQNEHSIEIRDVRLNGGAASYVLAPENSHYNDLDLIFGTDLSNEDRFDVIRDVVLECLMEFHPDNRQRLWQQQQQPQMPPSSHNFQHQQQPPQQPHHAPSQPPNNISNCANQQISINIKEAYVHKMVKVNDDDRWSLISLGVQRQGQTTLATNQASTSPTFASVAAATQTVASVGPNVPFKQQQQNQFPNSIELKFVDHMRRKFEFSVDSFQIILDSLIQFYDYAPQSTITIQKKLNGSRPLSSTTVNTARLLPQPGLSQHQTQQQQRCPGCCCGIETRILFDHTTTMLNDYSSAQRTFDGDKSKHFAPAGDNFQPNAGQNHMIKNYLRTTAPPNSVVAGVACQGRENVAQQQGKRAASLTSVGNAGGGTARAGIATAAARVPYSEPLPLDHHHHHHQHHIQAPVISNSSVASSSGCSSSSSVVSSSSSSLSCGEDDDHEEYCCSASSSAGDLAAVSHTIGADSGNANPSPVSSACSTSSLLLLLSPCESCTLTPAGGSSLLGCEQNGAKLHHCNLHQQQQQNHLEAVGNRLAVVTDRLSEVSLTAAADEAVPHASKSLINATKLSSPAQEEEAKPDNRVNTQNDCTKCFDTNQHNCCGLLVGGGEFVLAHGGGVGGNDNERKGRVRQICNNLIRAQLYDYGKTNSNNNNQLQYQQQQATSCAVISENFYPTVIGRSEYGDFKDALFHLEKKLIATRSPEEIRGGGLLKYCNLLVKNYKPTNVYQIRTLERYMCSRFFIDFSDLNQQRAKLESYLANHFCDDPIQKFDYLIILHSVVQRSTVCLMNHELRLTLNMIRELAHNLNEQQIKQQQQRAREQRQPASRVSQTCPAGASSSSVVKAAAAAKAAAATAAAAARTATPVAASVNGSKNADKN